MLTWAIYRAVNHTVNRTCSRYVSCCILRSALYQASCCELYHASCCASCLVPYVSHITLYILSFVLQYIKSSSHSKAKARTSAKEAVDEELCVRKDFRLASPYNFN